MQKEWQVVGVSGVTCGGKTTFASELHKIFPGSILIHQDKYFLPMDDQRHIVITHLNYINWEIMSSLDMDKMRSDVTNILNKPCPESNMPLLIIEGFLIFNDEYLSSICQHKLFFTLTKEQCWARRSSRTYEHPDVKWPPEVPGYFDEIVWPEYESHYGEAITMNKDLVLVDTSVDINPVLEELQILLTDKFKMIDCS